MEATQPNEITLVCIEPKFMQTQSMCLRRCIEQHKWFLSEKAKHDVGWDAAQADFIQKFLPGFAAGFRASFCGLICQKRLFCAIGRKYVVS